MFKRIVACGNIVHEKLMMLCSKRKHALQNLSQSKFSALLHAVYIIGKLNTINLKFMERDNSYLETETIRGMIERTRKIVICQISLKNIKRQAI